MELLFSLLLRFTDPLLYLFAIGGYVWCPSLHSVHPLRLLFFGTLYTYALKGSFRIPLPWGTGFAFPSGHMLAALMVYGWLFRSSETRYVKNTLLALLIGISYSLVYFGFHTYIDILGAWFFGLILLHLYTSIVYSSWREKLPSLLILSSTLLMIYILILGPPPHHIIIAYGMLLGFLAGDALPLSLPLLLRNQVYTSVYVVWLFSYLIVFPHTSGFHSPIVWMLIGYSLPFLLRWGTHTPEYLLLSYHHKQPLK